jgi:hypothetical protein
MKDLRIKDSATPEKGYQGTVRTFARKPYPSIAGLRNLQLLKTQTQRIGEVNLYDRVDNR